MYPAPFRYFRPSSVADAVTLMQQLGDGARPLAGGQSLIPILKMRMDEPSDLIDIGRIPELMHITVTNDEVRIGALMTHGQIATSEVANLVPAIGDTAGGIADPQVRNLGTIGGSVSVADPASDWPAVLHIVEADIHTSGPDGNRRIPIHEFIVDSYTNSLGAAELVTEVSFKIPPANSGSAYIGFKKAAPSYPAASVGIQLTLDNDAIKNVRLVLGASGPVPVTNPEAEAMLQGQKPELALLQQAADALVAKADPPSDARGSADFKRAVLKSLFIKTANVALQRAGGEKITGGHDYV